MTKCPELLPALQLKHSWNNKPRTANDTVVKKNAWKHSKVKKSSICGDKKKWCVEAKVFMAVFAAVQTTGLEIFQNWNWQKHSADTSADSLSSDRTFIFPSSSLPPVQWLQRGWGTIWLRAAAATTGTKQLARLCCPPPPPHTLREAQQEVCSNFLPTCSNLAWNR